MLRPMDEGQRTKDKDSFVTALITTAEGELLKIQLSVLIGFQSEDIDKWRQRYLLPGSNLVSDALACIGCDYTVLYIYRPTLT